MRGAKRSAQTDTTAVERDLQRWGAADRSPDGECSSLEI